MSPLPQDLLSQNLRGGSGYGLVSSKLSDDSQDADAVHWVPFPLHSEYLLCKVLRSPPHTHTQVENGYFARESESARRSYCGKPLSGRKKTALPQILVPVPL